MREDLNLKLQHHAVLTNEDCFDIAQEISHILNSSNDMEKQVGRNIIILLLDNWANVPSNYKELFFDLMSSAGFYPYIKNLQYQSDNLGEQIRTEGHKSLFLKDKYFHFEQKKVADLLHSHANVVVSAPTSFGKSMLIEEVVASKEYNNIVIIQPTLALLDETRRKLKKYAESYKIIVKTSQNFSLTKGNIFLLTAERVLEYPDMPNIQLLILDEFYKLSNKREDNRSNILNTAFVRIMKNPDCRFYMLGPNIDSIPEGFKEKYNAAFVKTNFSMVHVETENKFDLVSKKQGGKVLEDDLFKILDNLNEQTLIFCSSPRTARKLAFAYFEHTSKISKELSPALPLIDWINTNLSVHWSLVKCLDRGIAVHDGSMPKHITSSTISYFNQKMIKYLFCTNTIIEGVNTCAKNVVFYDNKIGSRKIDYFDYSNIKGRAGRLMEHYTGKIINLHKPPEKETMNVDFPFFVQNPIASEVLVNLDEADVRNINDNLQRFQDFMNKDEELRIILKRNAVSIEGQETILKVLLKDLADPSRRTLIQWSTIDKNLYKRIQYIFDLCWDNLSTPDERKSFGSKGWVVNKIVGSCFSSNINNMIENDLEFMAKKLAKDKGKNYISVKDMFANFPLEMQAIADDAIEKIFAFQKNWMQYRAPKWINVVDSLQKYASKKLNLPSGDYSYVAEMIESEFIDSSLRILLEYGIPRSAIEKIKNILKYWGNDSKNLSEDQLIELLSRRKNELAKHLSKYEMEVINRSL